MTTTVRGFRDFILERVPEWNSLDLERKHFALRQILAQPGLVLINLVPHFSHLVNPIPVIPSVSHSSVISRARRQAEMVDGHEEHHESPVRYSSF